MYNLTDRPGRWLAVLVIGPMLLVAARLLCASCAHNRAVATLLQAFSLAFMAYETFWIATKPPERC